jgi:hypothetical protein
MDLNLKAKSFSRHSYVFLSFQLIFYSDFRSLEVAYIRLNEGHNSDPSGLNIEDKRKMEWKVLWICCAF